MIFTKRTGLENKANQAIHELIEERKRKPIDTPENELSTSQESQPEEKKEITGSGTYGTNLETQRALFNGSYHTFTTSGSNQLQCACCPEPILINASDAREESKTNYLTSTSTETKSDYLFSKPKKSSYTF